MKTLVQSKCVLSQNLLYVIWRKSSSEDSFQEWLKNPETDLGTFTQDSFWINWVKTNKGLVPVIEREILLDWRILIQLGKDEGQTFIFEESPISVFVYQADNDKEKLVHYQLAFSPDGLPKLHKNKASALPQGLATKVAATKRHLPAGIQKRLAELHSRLRQLTERRA